MVSAEDLLKRKFIKPEDPDYGLVPMMAVWHYDCPYCDIRCVSSSQIGVMSRQRAHVRKCPEAPWNKVLKVGDKEDN